MTAYDLLSGHAIWLTPEGAWSEWIENARIGRSAADFDEMSRIATAAGAANEIFESYLVDVEEPGPRPVKYRESMRARGPTVHPDFGVQAARRARGPARPVRPHRTPA